MKSIDANIDKKELLDKIKELQLNIDEKEKRLQEINNSPNISSYQNELHAEIEKLSKVGVWKVILPDLTVEWSDELYNIFELNKETTKLDYNTFLEYIHPIDRNNTQKELELAISEKKTINLKHRIITHSGSIKVLHVSGKVYFDKNDHPLEILGATQDITELINIETSKWENEENFSSIFNHSPSALAITSIKEGKIIEVNTAFCDILSVQKVDLIGRKTTELNLWSDQKVRKDFLQKLKDQGSVRNFESKSYSLKGEEKWVLLSAEMIKFNKQNCILTTITDITERREAEIQNNLLNRTLKTISEVNQLIVREHNKNKMLSETCKILVEHGKFSTAWVGMVDENHKIVPAAEYGFPKNYLSSINIDLLGKDANKSLMATSINSSKEIICNDINKEDRFTILKENAEKFGFNSSAAFPLIVDKKVIGAINISHYDGSEFSDDIIDLMKELAGDISLSLKLMQESEKRKKAQKDLKIRENHLSVLFNNNSDLQLLLSVHSNDQFIIEEVNKTYLSTVKRIFPKIKRKDLLGKNLIEVILQILELDEEVLDYTINNYKQAVKSGELVHYEESFDFENFTYYSEVTIVPVIDDEGKCNYVLWNSRDVSDRKEAEKSLKLANLVIENSPAILFRWKAVVGWPVDFVSGNIQQFGYSAKEFLSGETSYLSIIHPDDIEKVADEVERYSNDGSDHFRQEYRIITKDKKVIWIDDRTMIERNKNGDIEYYQGVVIDITHKKIIESALWETQHMLNIVLDNIPQRIFWKDKNYTYLGCNKLFAQDAGVDHPDQILGKSDFELSWKEVAHLYRADDVEILEKNITKINYEEPQVRDDGSKVWLRTSKLPLKNQEGEILGVLGCYDDITERKLSEKALEESEKRFRNFINQTSDGFYMLATDNPVDLTKKINEQLTDSYENFYVKECNDIFAQMYGYKSSDAMKNIALKEIHGDWDKQKNIESFKKFLSSGLKINNSETAEYDKNNNVKYFLNNYIGIVEGNLLKEIWGTQQDITFRKQAELALLESEEKFKSVFTDSHDCIYVTSSDGRIINMNSAGLELFDISQEEILNYNVSDFYVDSEERKKFQIDINNEGFVKDYPVSLKTANNKILDCLLTASIKKDSSDNIISYQGIIRDITLQKKAQIQLLKAKEDAEKADRLKTEFLAQMSHEIRTPINTLLSFSSLIREETTKYRNTDLEEYFNYQTNAGNRIIRTIDLILNMSEVQVGSFQTNITKLNLAKILDELFKENIEIAKKKGLKLKLSNSEKKLLINGDDYSIRQIFGNLIDNAIKYTDKGSIKISVKSRLDEVNIEVSDTGIGISKEYIHQIFQPFSQEEQGYSRKFEGSGLGLALVKKYCDINNAEINVKSSKNKGTIFSVKFKLIK